jgi:hypothetical protein
MDGIIQNLVAPRMFALHIAFMIGKNNNMALYKHNSHNICRNSSNANCICSSFSELKEHNARAIILLTMLIKEYVDILLFFLTSGTLLRSEVDTPSFHSVISLRDYYPLIPSTHLPNN